MIHSRRPRCVMRVIIAAAVAPVVFCAAPAAAQTFTWTKTAGTTNWNTAANWTPATVPNSATADVIFDTTGVGAVNIAASVQARSIAFTNSSGSYNLTSSAGQTLSAVQAITNDLSFNTQTVNLAAVATGSLLFPGGAGLTIANDALVFGGSPTLVIGPNTVIGATGGGLGVTVTGSSITEISGSFASGANQLVGGLTKTGTGTLVLSGNGTNLQGPVTLSAGTMELNYTGSTANKLGSGALTLAGGDLTLLGHAATAVTQTATGGTAVNAGHSSISSTTTGGSLTLALNGISRSTPGTLDVAAAAGTAVTTTAGLTNGILGGWATAGGGSGWATKSGSNIIPLAAGGGSVGPGLNTDIGSSGTLGTATTNSIRFTAASTMTLTGTLTLQSGGVLLTPTAGDSLITGGTLTATGGGELIVHAYGFTNDLTINSALSSTAGLTKTGSGNLILGGSNSGLSGPVNVNQGNLFFTSLNAMNLTAINLNDRSGNSQSLIFELPDGQNATAGPTIRLGVGSVVMNFAEDSRITLNDIISSPVGLTTPLRVGGSGLPVTSGFNLTNTANTFTGDVTLDNGFLGIAADGSLGNAANTLILDSGPNSGGLEFLNNGTTVAHPVRFAGTSRVLVNGANVDTISGVISGSGALDKDGTGTLVLTGSNTITGGIVVSAGALRVSAAANLGTGGIIAISSAGTLAATGSFTLPAGRTVRLHPTAGGTPTVDVSGGAVVTFAGTVSNNSSAGALLKSGFGTLALTGTANTYSGGTTVQQGTLQVAADGSLGAAAGPVTVDTFGALTFTGSTSTGRTFALNSGTLSAGPGAQVLFHNATVGGGFLAGPGVFATQAGGSNTFVGSQTTTSSDLTLNGTDSLTNFSNGGQLTIPATRTSTLTRFTNTSSGRTTVSGTANVSDFVSAGRVTINPGATTNNTAAPMVLGGGSITDVGSSAAPGGAITLGGQSLELHGGLLANFGTISGGTLNIYYGGLAAGNGTFPMVVVHPGGAYTPGMTLSNIPAPSAVSTGDIHPLDPNQTTATSVLLNADTIATVNTADGTLTFSSPLNGQDNTLTKVGGGTLALANLRAGGLAVDGGTVKVLPDGTSAGTSQLATLSVAAGSKLDLTDNKLIVVGGDLGSWNGSVYTGVTGLVDAGRGDAGNAVWDGSGIITSDTRSISNGDLTSIGVATAGQLVRTTFGGISVSGEDVLVMFTWGGDANLDGKINIDDYGRIDGNVGQSGSVFGWDKGDFNYDGKINIDDYGIIDGNINRQGAPFSTAGSGISGALESAAAVPEPAVLSLLGFLSLCPRRRRRFHLPRADHGR